MRSPLPEALVEHALNYSGPPATPVAATTIVLLREGQDGVETYLLRRSPQLKFAPSFDVFPGGRVDTADREMVPGWSREDGEYWATVLQCDEESARAVVVAAVRETFEESGVLMGIGPPQFWSTPSYVTERRQDRVALETSGISLSQFFQEHGLELRPDYLAPWSHWLTPEFEPRRYATWFLLAAVPPGQSVDHVPGETDEGRWLPLCEIPTAAESGDIRVLPPTLTTCSELEGMDLATIMATARTQQPVRHTATLVKEEGGFFLEH